MKGLYRGRWFLEPIEIPPSIHRVVQLRRGYSGEEGCRVLPSRCSWVWERTGKSCQPRVKCCDRKSIGSWGSTEMSLTQPLSHGRWKSRPWVPGEERGWTMCAQVLSKCLVGGQRERGGGPGTRVSRKPLPGLPWSPHTLILHSPMGGPSLSTVYSTTSSGTGTPKTEPQLIRPWGERSRYRSL